MPSEQSKGMTLLLVRHGQAAADAEGIYGAETGLTELGRKQAEAVARTLQPKAEFQFLYVSPIRRAAETTEPIAERLGLKPVFDNRLVEIEASRQVVLQIMAGGVWPSWQDHHRSHGGEETLGDFGTRVGSFFREVAERHAGHELVVVAHGGV